MKYLIDKQEKYAHLKLEESNLNSLVAPKLKSELVLLANEGIQNLILDLATVEYIDSSGLSSLLTANRLFSESGTFVLTGADNPHVKNLIELSRLETVLNIIPSLEESVDYVFMEEVERELKGEEPKD